MEVTTAADDDVKVCGMMHLLISGHFETKDRLYETLEHVYRNFTTIYIALDDVLFDLYAKFSRPEHHELSIKTGYMTTFCRCNLMRIFMEDGITINPSSSDLLAEIESYLLYLLNNPNEQMDWLSEKGKYMMVKIGKAYLEPSSIYCYHLVINKDLMMEFLNHCADTSYYLNKDRRIHLVKQEFILLRNYVGLLTKDQVHGANLDNLLIAVEDIAYYLACYLGIAELWPIGFNEHYGHDDADGHISSFRWGVLYVLSSQQDGGLLMSDELLNGYVKCVQDNLLKLLKDNQIILTDTSKSHLMNLHGGLSFLMHLLVTHPPMHISEQKKFVEIRLDFQVLVRNVGFMICSFFYDPETEEMSLGLFDLIEKTDVIKGEFIKTVCCIILQKMELESPKKQDQLGYLILLLQNLKEFMDHNPGLILTWKEHDNLVLFIFYLIQNRIRDSKDDEFSRNAFQLDISPFQLDVINHEELNGVLISAQVNAFNMACCYLLRRYRKFHWWELYMGTKERVDVHMCVGILKTFGLSSTTHLTNELLIAYGECVVDSLLELLRLEPVDPLKDQFNILHEEFSFLVRLLIIYRDEHVKLSHTNAGFQDLMRRVGFIICSRFNNRLNGDMTTKQSTNELSNVLEKLSIIKVETQEILNMLILSKIGRESPKTNQLGSLNFLLENWKELMECESDLINTWKDQFQMIHENFLFFKSFITNSIARDDVESKDLCSSIVDAGHVAEYLLTTFSIGTCPFQRGSLWISEFMSHVELIKASVMEINEKKGNVIETSTTGKDRNQVSAQALLVPTPIDLVVGFEAEMEHIKKRLTARLKQLDVISITGMPGLGKTTLARKVYEDPFTKNYFDACAWCCVSQEYNKKQLLLTILDSVSKLTDEIRKQSESQLSVMVHKQFKGRRYFIVLDDIWDISVFMDLKCFFPDDNKGSRIMLTTRSKVIGSQAQGQCHNNLIEPGILTDEESWYLLERKVYQERKCPAELCQLGKEITRKCRGLPLAIVVVGGVLAKGAQTRDFWEQVTNNLSLFLARDSESQFMAALELSYSFSPNYLKPMFLYLGAFPEDKEIHADTLMQLWMAEGFLQKNEPASLKVQAETNLVNLIDRSLVMVAKRRSDGRVRSCHVHDLLRYMCLVKAKEEKFMHQVDVHSKLPDPVMYQHRLSIIVKGNEKITSRHFLAFKDPPKFSITPPIYSLLFFDDGSSFFQMKEEDFVLVISSLKLLKVFDAAVFYVTQDVFNHVLTKLVHLRYLSFSGGIMYIPSSISQLRSLEILIIKYESRKSIRVSERIWETTKLRHLDIGNAEFTVVTENSFILENLETLSTPHLDFNKEEMVFRKVPSLKKLKCSFKGYRSRQWPNFEILDKLESLRLYNKDRTRFEGQFKLPLTLKKLSIYMFCNKWSQISSLWTLPNLEVLKVDRYYATEEYWDMEEEDVFTNLKFLMLEDLKIERWTASSVNFPSLEKLILHDCYELEEIPSDLGEFDTLREIEVKRCGSSVVKLVKEIQKEQEEFGNDSLKFYFYENRE